MPGSLNLRVFLSSPGDVAEERRLAREVMQALEGSHLLRGRVRFEIVAWDDHHAAAPMDARETPQASVNRYTGRPADCDLTLVILWSRIGTCLPQDLTRPDGTRYESGTVWEVEDAVAADKPVFVYRRTEIPRIDLDDPEFESKRTQYDAVKGYFAKFQNADGSLEAGFNPYPQPLDFANLLREHLEAFVDQHLGAHGASATPPIGADDPTVTRILTLIDEVDRKNRQIDEKDAEIARLRDENDALRRAAIARTLTAAAQPQASPEAAAAGAALEAGNSVPAEALLREQELDLAQAPITDDTPAHAQRKQAAELAREQGALAVGRDARAALTAYQRAAEYEPEDTRTLFAIGDLHLQLGDSDAAALRFRSAAAIAEALAARDPANTAWQRDLSVSHEKIGNVLLAQGDRSTALVAFRESLAIREALAARNPVDQGWQRGLSVSHEKIGDVLVAQGDGPAALVAFRKSLTIREALAAGDPANTEWQRDLSVSHIKIGDVLLGQGDGPAALAAYRKSLAIFEALAARDSVNTGWQRDLSVAYDRVGNVLAAQSDGPATLTVYRSSLAIREALAERDPANTEWQRDVSVSYDKIGNVLLAEGDRHTALAAFHKGLAIREALAARDPANTVWLRDVSVSLNKIGDALLAQGDQPAALASFCKSLAIRESLAARDPLNTAWQHDLSVSHTKVGDALAAQGDGAAALAAYRMDLTIADALAARDPASAQWQADLAVSCAKLGSLEHGLSVEARRDHLLRGRDILIALKAAGRLMPNQDWIAWFEQQLAKLPPTAP